MLQTARMEYTATAFANPFKRSSTSSTGPRSAWTSSFIPTPASSCERIEYANPTRPLFEEWLYQPALAALSRVAALTRRVQSGSANAYLAYILAALLLLLVLA